MNIQNDRLFGKLNHAEVELMMWMLNVGFPGPAEVTLENIKWYRLESIKWKLDKIRLHLKPEHKNMYDSIYLKLELHKVLAKEF